MKTLANLMKSVAVLTALTLASCAPTYQGGYGQGGGRPVQQQRQIQPQLKVGDFVSSECFGNQPIRPTSGCVKITWDQAFGPQGPWINDFGGGRAQVQHIPTGQLVMFDQQNKWAWKVPCDNRVMLVIPQRQQAPQQAPPQQRRSGGWTLQLPNINVIQGGGQRYCPQMMRPNCPPPPPRNMYGAYCPPGQYQYWQQSQYQQSQYRYQPQYRY